MSATASALTPGVVSTATPDSVAAGMSTASEPVPQRRIALRSGSASSTPRVYGSLPATTAQAPARPRTSTSSSRAEDSSYRSTAVISGICSSSGRTRSAAPSARTTLWVDAVLLIIAVAGGILAHPLLLLIAILAVTALVSGRV